MRMAIVVACLTSCVRLPTAPHLIDDSARLGLVASGAAEAIDFTVTRVADGSPYKLSDDRGSVVLIDVWATWCEPCRESLPVYDDVAKQFAGQGLKVYAMSVDADPKVIAPFLAELKVSLPALHDPEAALAGKVLKVRQMPTTILVDRKGVVRRVHEGLNDEFLQETLADVEAVLAEKPAEAKKSP